MPRVIPDSRSLILRSTHIIHFGIASSTPAPWGPDERGIPKRKVNLAVRTDEVLKGEVDDKPGSTVRIEPVQTGRPGTRIYAVPGVWSDTPVESGGRLVAFCRSTSRSVAQLLVEPDCQALYPSEECLLDVRLAMRAEKEDLTIARLLELARPEAASLHFLWAEYLGCRLRIPEPDAVADFRFVTGFLEIPELAPIARSTLLSSVTDRVLGVDPAPPPYVNALAVTLFNLLAIPQASADHSSIVTMHLPDLFGLRGGASRKTADQVFGGDQHAIARASKILHDYRGPESTDVLKRWLEQRP